MIKKTIISNTLALLVATATQQASAEPQPIGYWMTVDDSGKNQAAIVEVFQYQGLLRGRIVKLINPEVPNPKCDKCSGDKKGQPVLGMEIMWGLKQDGSEWSGGSILDPENGSVYRCYIEPVEGGKKLKVRGYLGISLLGRTQYWVRANAPKKK